MVNSYTRRNKKSTCPCEVSDLEETARKAAAVHGNVPDNSSKVPNMDPLYRLTTIFTNNFDAVGREHARELSEGNKTEKREFSQAEKQTQEKQATEVELRKRHDSPEYVHSTAELNAGGFTDRFSAYAFRGGKLAASVMAGQGRQMFTLCLANALGKPFPQGDRQKKLLGQSQIEMPVPSREADVRFNRDVHSAVGIVTDTLKSSGKLLEIFRDLATGNGQKIKDPLKIRNVGTLDLALPFFDTDRDKRLLAQYKERLKSLENDSSPEAENTAGILRSAMTKQNAVLKKKQQEQRDFLTVLDRISSNVREAEKLFSSDGFAEEAMREAEALTADVPLDDGNDRRRIAEEISMAVADFMTGLRGEKNSGAGKEKQPDRKEKPGSGEENKPGAE